MFKAVSTRVLTPLLLMGSSLVLLAVFLGVWLKKTYEEELNALKQEGNVVFINTVRSMEGEYLEKMFGSGIAPPPRMAIRTANIESWDSAIDVRYMGPADGDFFWKTHTDTNFRVVQFNNTPENNGRPDTMIRVIIRTDSSEAGNKRFVGSLSMMVALSANAKRNPADSLLPTLPDSSVPSLLATRFDQNMQASGLPLSYRLLRWDDTLPQGCGFSSDTYFDMASGDRYSVEFSGYAPVVWQRMLPELGFALLLYACVALAFFTIYRGWRKQQRLTELKNDFINNVTHELKTPISTVSVAIEALRDFDAMNDPRRSGEYLDIARQELGRLGILVDKVLKMSLFEHNQATLKPEDLDFRTLVEDVLNAMRLQFEKFGAHVHFETDGYDFTFTGDRLHLTSVVYNLLDNALKYSNAEPEIQVSLAQENGMLKMTVRDRGVGIPPEYADKIFDKFFRVPTGNVHNVRGHGLGLHYVAGVVRQHLGSIRAERNPDGPGSCFTVLLPQTI